MITIREYVKPESLEEAWQLNQKKSNKIIAGMLWTKMSSGNVQTAIDLSGLGLDKIEETEEEFIFGCMTSLRDLEIHPGFDLFTDGAARESVKNIVGVQFRNLATVGGSIFGRYGFSDVLTLFMALDAQVELYKGGIIPVKEFATMDYDRDLLVRVIVKKNPGVFAYQSVRNNAKTDFPVLTCAAARREEDGVCQVAIGARPHKAVLFRDVDGILNEEITEETADRFAEYVKQSVVCGTNMRGSKEYRKHLAYVLTKRTVLQLGGLTCR